MLFRANVNRGFTLTEVLVSLAILAVLVVGVLALLHVSGQQMILAVQLTENSEIAQTQIDRIRAEGGRNLSKLLDDRMNQLNELGIATGTIPLLPFPPFFPEAQLGTAGNLYNIYAVMTSPEEGYLRLTVRFFDEVGIVNDEYITFMARR